MTTQTTMPASSDPVRYKLRFVPKAAAVLKALKNGGTNEQVRRRQVGRALGLLERNPRHPVLHSHQYESFPIDRDIKVWDSYVDNRTPSAWRIFWRYGPDEAALDKPVITVLAIGPHE
jgi:hypothetical protein